jgi:hypothetical protein
MYLTLPIVEALLCVCGYGCITALRDARESVMGVSGADIR